MAPKAKGESKRGLVVALVFFILATIGAGLAAYYGFADQDKKEKDVIKAKEDMKLATSERDFYRFVIAVLEAYIDKSPDPNSPTGRELNNKAAFEAGTYPDAKVSALDGPKSQIPVTKALLIKLAARSPWDKDKNNPRDNYEALLKERDAKFADLDTKRLNAEKETEAAKKKRDEALADLAKDKASHVNALAKVVENFADERKAYTANIEKYEKQLKEAENTKDDKFIKPIVDERDRALADSKKLAQQLKEANDKLLAMQAKFDVRTGGEDKPLEPKPRGTILRVHVNPRKATINLGRRDGLTPQTTFAVHGYQPNGKPKVRSKANVEVITVGETTSEVLVTSMFHPDADSDHRDKRKVIDVLSKDNTDPIIANDALINPVWNPNVKTHIAIAGSIDLYGTGAINIATLVRQLEQVNVVVDAYVDPLDGSVKGRVTRRTDFVLLGSKPTEKDLKDVETRKKITDEIDKMVNQARLEGIRTLTPKRFLEDTGFNLPRTVVAE